ncbi:hypothetical protein ACH3XW_16235 [Acanthocheilonema viteae]
MTKLIIYLAFVICYGAQAGTAQIITSFVADKLWDNGQSVAITLVEEATMMNCDTVYDGRLFASEDKSLLFVRNTFSMIK